MTATMLHHLSETWVWWRSTLSTSTINPQTTDGQTVVKRQQLQSQSCTGDWSGARDMVSKNTYGMTSSHAHLFRWPHSIPRKWRAA